MTQKNEQKLSSLGLLIWLIGALFFLYEFFLRTFVGTLAHQIIPALKLTPELFALMGTAYYFSYALMQIPVGVLADRFGVKIILISASTVCALATFLFAHSNGFSSAFFSRILMGLGSAFAFVCLLVIAATWFPRRYFGFFAGASQFIGTMGPLLSGGPLVALLAKTHGNWRLTMSEIGAFGIALAVLILFFVKNKPRGGERALIYLSLSIPLKTKLLRLARNTQAWWIAAYSATAYASLGLLGAVWGTDYLEARNLSQSSAANIISFSWLAYAIACPTLGAVSDKIKRRKPILISTACLGLVTGVLLLYLPTQNSVVYGLLFFCLGISATGQSLAFATISEHVDLEAKATALGLNNGTIMLFTGIVPLSTAYFMEVSHNTSVLHNFIIGLSIIPILYVVAIIISTVFIKETYCKPQKETIVLEP